jgi:gas vesicle protein
MESVMKFIWGLLIGFALGVAAGLLLAPQAGQDTLAQLGEQGVTLRDRSGSVTGDLLARANNLSGELRVRANEAMIQGRELYNRTKDELNERYQQAKNSGQM